MANEERLYTNLTQVGNRLPMGYAHSLYNTVNQGSYENNIERRRIRSTREYKRDQRWLAKATLTYPRLLSPAGRAPHSAPGAKPLITKPPRNLLNKPPPPTAAAPLG